MIRRKTWSIPLFKPKYITTPGPGQTIRYPRAEPAPYGPTSVAYNLPSKGIKTGVKVSARRKKKRIKPTNKSKYVRKIIPTQKDWDFVAGNRASKNMSKNITVNEGNGTTWEQTMAPMSPGLTHGPEITIKYEKDKVANHSSGDMSAPRRVHRSNIETGVPTAKAIHMQGKLDGVVRKVMCNTKLYVDQDTSSLVQRSLLDHANGFNCKKYWFMPGHACPGYLDLIEVLTNSSDRQTWANWLNADTSAGSYDRRYASIKSITTNMSFSNETPYFPVKMKLHMIRPKIDITKENDNPTNISKRSHVQNMVENVFSPTVIRDFAIPFTYKVNEPLLLGVQETVTGSDNYRKVAAQVDVQNRTHLNMSSYFRDKYEIVKTIYKTLNPNDSWHFTHKHHFGSGIDVDAFRAHFRDMNGVLPATDAATDRLGNDQPLTYFWMVESCGVPCSATVGDGAFGGGVVQSTYQGTSPGVYHCEFKTQVEFVTPSNTTATNLTAAGVPEFVHIRQFKKRELLNTPLGNRIRAITAENIVNSIPEVTANKAYIPVLTDKLITSRQTRGVSA